MEILGRRIEVVIVPELSRAPNGRCYNFEEVEILRAMNAWNARVGSSICLVPAASTPNGAHVRFDLYLPSRPPQTLVDLWRHLVPSKGEDDIVDSWQQLFGDSGTVAEAETGFQGNRGHLIRIRAVPGVGSVVHEIAHVFGVLHELQHCRRDEFIELDLLDRLADFIPGESGKQCSVDRYLLTSDYDFASVMHYPEFVGRDTRMFRLKPPGESLMRSQGIASSSRIGSWTNGLSNTDVSLLQEFYGTGGSNCPVIAVPEKGRIDCSNGPSVPLP